MKKANFHLLFAFSSPALCVSEAKQHADLPRWRQDSGKYPSADASCCFSRPTFTLLLTSLCQQSVCISASYRDITLSDEVETKRLFWFKSMALVLFSDAPDCTVKKKDPSKKSHCRPPVLSGTSERVREMLKSKVEAKKTKQNRIYWT